MPWLVAEDGALKRRLQGLTVDDVNAPPEGRAVAVRFRFPETELSGVTFPMIVIEHHALDRDPEREFRAGPYSLPYAPEGYEVWPEAADPKQSPYWVPEAPIPYNVDYLVTLWARKILHIQYLVALLLQPRYLHPRYACLEVPEDGTVRRLDTLGGPSPNDTLDDDGKRLFRRSWLIRVSTELLPSQVYQFSQVLSVHTDLTAYKDLYDIDSAYDTAHSVVTTP